MRRLIVSTTRNSPTWASSLDGAFFISEDPRESSGGGRQQLGAISKHGNSRARYLLVEAGQTAARYDEELRRDYQRLKFRRGTAVAKVAIAWK
jgi:transposase